MIILCTGSVCVDVSRVGGVTIILYLMEQCAKTTTGSRRMFATLMSVQRLLIYLVCSNKFDCSSNNCKCQCVVGEIRNIFLITLIIIVE